MDSSRGTPLRALIVADSDSYLKWAVTRLVEVDDRWSCRIAVVRNSGTPSPAQREAAVDGRIPLERLEVMAFGDLVGELSSDPPDILILATRGPFIDELLAGRMKGRLTSPVIVAGIPGIWMPPTALGLQLRRGADLMVVHSHAEREAVRAMLTPGARLSQVGLASLRSSGGQIGRSPRPRVVFAPQALVPQGTDARTHLFEALVRTARAHPDVDVVIKLRGGAGEAQTHSEIESFPSIAERSGEPLPDNLVFRHGPLREFLGDCVGFVTVSSTAAIEAIEAGVPTLCLSDYGVGVEQINTVFEGSGLFGTVDDLVALRFHQPAAEWRSTHYFHDSDDDDWADVAESAARTRDASRVPVMEDLLRGPLGPLRRMRRRYMALRTL